MPRARAGAARHRRKVRLFRDAKGFRGARSRCYRTAKEAITRAGVYAFRDRRARKRDFRCLWVTRLSAACKARNIAYSRFIYGIQAAQVVLNRKMMSEIAIADPKAFDAIADIARQHLPKDAA